MSNFDVYYFSGDEETYTTLDNAAAVDASDDSDPKGGLVTLTSTDHGFKAGTSIYIQGTTNYDGLRYIHAVATNTITIRATYVAETPAGTETLKTMVGFENPHEVAGWELTLSAASATSENLTVTKDADKGVAWDVNYLTKDMNGHRYIVTEEDDGYPILLEAGDKLDFAWANTNDRTWGLKVMARRVG